MPRRDSPSRAARIAIRRIAKSRGIRQREVGKSIVWSSIPTRTRNISAGMDPGSSVVVFPGQNLGNEFFRGVRKKADKAASVGVGKGIRRHKPRG